jgi:hypothetical protein
MVNDATDIKVTSRGVDLTQFSSYFGRYAGYAVDKGKLDLDCDYRVTKRKLTANNQIKADQFTFGEATNSKEATKFPVKFGLAVLKDKDGLVDLDVPVKGNVDDPNFRLYKVVWKAITDLLVKTVTSPLAVLGKVFGGGTETLDVIDFQPGAPDLTPGAEKSLQGISRALAGRPALRMDIEGTTDPTADVKALKLRELKQQAGAAKGSDKNGRDGLSDEEYLRFLENRYRALPASATGAAPDPATMENAVLAAQHFPAEALASLQQQRADAARVRLVALGVDASRLSLARGGERAEKEGGARVYFTLK